MQDFTSGPPPGRGGGGGRSSRGGELFRPSGSKRLFGTNPVLNELQEDLSRLFSFSTGTFFVHFLLKQSGHTSAFIIGMFCGMSLLFGYSVMFHSWAAIRMCAYLLASWGALLLWNTNVELEGWLTGILATLVVAMFSVDLINKANAMLLVASLLLILDSILLFSWIA